jgi:RHS repeat-associated protein
VSLSQASGKTVTVSYGTSNGTAVSTSDYTSAAGTLTFNPGEQSKTISVVTTNDSTEEIPMVEDFFVNLGSPTNAAIDDGEGQGIIVDNDGSRTVNVSDQRVTEGQTANVLIYLSGPSESTITVDYASVENPAEDPEDYTGASGTVTFAPGEIFKVVSFATVDDDGGIHGVEDDEFFSVDLSNPSNTTIGRDLGKVTITEEELPHQTIRSCDCDCGCPHTTTSENLDSGGEKAKEANDGSIHSGHETNPHPVVLLDTSFTAHTLANAKYIEVQLTFGGLEQESIFYSTDGIAADESVRFALQADAQLPTGRYDWEVTITEHYPDGTEVSRTLTGHQAIVNLAETNYGRRVWFDYLDYLVVQDDGVLWVRGTTDTFWFQEDGVGGYQAAAGDLSGSSLVDNIDGSYTLTTKDGSVSQFDEDGLLTERQDANGNTWTYEYTDADEDEVEDELLRVTDPAGRETTFAYTDGLLSSITNDEGTTTYEHDEEGRLIEITRPDPDGAGELEAPVTTFDYEEGTHLLTSLTRASGSTTTFEYNEFRMLSKRINPDESFREYDPILSQGLVDTSSGLGTPQNLAPMLATAEVLGSFTNELGETQTFTTDRFGYFTSTTDDLGNTTTYERDADGRILSITEPDPDGAGELESPVTTFDYDEQGNLTLITFADETTQEFEYDETWSQVTSFTDELGRVTLFEIDPTTGNVTEVRRVVGEVDDEINEETDDVVTSFTYTVSPVDPGDPPAGLVETVTDPLGRVTLYEYDEQGLVTQITFADGTADEAAVEFDYDEAGHLTGVTDELGRETTYEVDALGRVTKVTLPDPDGEGELEAPEWTYVYNIMNGVASMTDPLGRVTTYQYGAFGLLTRVDRPDHDEDEDPTRTEFDYDDAGRLIGVTDPLGREIAYDLDELGRVETVTLPDPDGEGELEAPETLYEYDNLSRLISETDALGRVTTYEYDARNRLVKTTLPDPDGVGELDAPEILYAYDDAGQLTSVTDALGNVTSYEYDELGRLVEMTLPDPDGAGELDSPVWTYEYDKVGNLRFVTDPLENVTEYVYDNRDRLVQVIEADPDGVGGLTSPETTYEYDDAGQLTSVTDALGRVTSYEYDGLGRLIEVTLPDPDGAGELDSPAYQYAYDAVGNLILATDALGNETAYEYDSLDNLVLVTLPDPDGEGVLTSPETQYEWDAAGQLLSVTDPLDRVTAYSYDALGRMVEMTLPDPDGGGGLASPVWEYAYDSAGNLVGVTDPLEAETEYAYDDLDRLIQVTLPDPDGGGGLESPEMHYAYDSAGQLVSVTDPLEQVTSYEYDNLGRRIATTLPDPDGEGELDAPEYQYAYDPLGNLTLETDPLGNETSYAYDNLFRLLSVTQPDPDGVGGLDAPETSFAYDAVGNRTSLTDPLGNTTEWTFDDLDRVIEEENELADSRFYAYDAASRLVETTDRNERVTQYEYDNLGRLTAEVWLESETPIRTIGFEYDAASQLVSAADPDSSYAYQYDNLGRPIEVTVDVGGPEVVFAQAYDAAGNRTSLAAEIDSTDDFLTEFEYDALGRMTRIEQAGQVGGNSVAEKRIDLAYTADGQYASIQRYSDLDGGGGNLVAETTYEYDDLGRLTGLAHEKGTTTFADYAWQYDAFSRVTSFSRDHLVGGSDSVDYSYDTTGQLTGADYGTQADETYEYDEAGNRTMSGYDTDPNNRLASDGVFNYTYDDEGNRLTKVRISNDPADDKTVEYEYDHRNRLTEVTFKDNSGDATKVVEYEYDVFDRRIAKTLDPDGLGVAGTTTERYVYDGRDIVLQFDEEDDLTHRYLHGPGIDEVFADENLLDEVLWSLGDNQGTPRDLIDSAGNVENHIDYEGFGQVADETDEAVDFLFGYTGLRRDEDTGLLGSDTRWYDADTGNWISEDPIGFAGGDSNLSRYVGNGPTNATDPSGLVEIPESGVWPNGEPVGEAPAWYESFWLSQEEFRDRQFLAGVRPIEDSYDLERFMRLTLCPDEFDTWYAEWLGKAQRNSVFVDIDGVEPKYSDHPHDATIRQWEEAVENGGWPVAIGMPNGMGEHLVNLAGAGCGSRHPLNFEEPSTSPGRRRTRSGTPRTEGGTTPTAAETRAENIAKGIPESQLGPSGQPKRHSVDHSTRKRAKDAARQSGKGEPIHNPSDVGQPPHFHAVDAQGNKIGKQSPHHNYPPSQK